MCRKNEVDCSFIKLVTLFYHWIQGDKTRYFVHGETFEVQHEIHSILSVELKRHRILNYKSSISIRFPQYVKKRGVFDDGIIACKLLVWKC